MNIKQSLYVSLNVITILAGFYVLAMFWRLYQTTGSSESTLGVSIPSPDPLVVSVVTLVVLALSGVAVRNLVTIYRRSKRDAAGEGAAN